MVIGESATAPQSTRIGCIVHQPDRLVESMAAKVELQGIVVELRYLGSIAELDNAEIAAAELIGEMSSYH